MKTPVERQTAIHSLFLLENVFVHRFVVSTEYLRVDRSFDRDYTKKNRMAQLFRHVIEKTLLKTIFVLRRSNSILI